MIDRIVNFFSREFLLSFFFPWLVFSFINLLIFRALFGQTYDPISWYLAASAEHQALIAGVGLFALAVLAYGTSPLVEPARAVLEGKYLPPAIAAWWRNGFNEMAIWLEQAFIRVAGLRYDLDAAMGGLGEDVVQARESGEPDPKVGQLIHKARLAILGTLSEPDLETVVRVRLATARNLVLHVIRASSTDQNEEIDDLLHKLQEAYAKSRDRCDAELRRLDKLQNQEFPSSAVAPTRLGNVVAAANLRHHVRLGMDSEYVWPRLEAVIAPDALILKVLKEARTKLEFAVIACSLFAVLPVVWLPVILLVSPSPGMFLLIGAGAPMISFVFYLITIQNYLKLADTREAAVDLHRFDLLNALNLRLPQDLASERKIWTALSQVLETGGDSSIIEFAVGQESGGQ